MCGITGWANLDPRTPPPEGGEELLRSMCDRMIHRGPDSEGYLFDDGIALGMRRLAIIDLLTGEQPTFNEDHRVAVILNGEIYNYRELRADLETRGHTFRSASDTEVLPHLCPRRCENDDPELRDRRATRDSYKSRRRGSRR